MCNRVSNSEPVLFSNKIKKYIFNLYTRLQELKEEMLRHQLQRKKIGKKTTDKLIEITLSWKEEVDGKFTLKALSKKSKSFV